MSWRLTRAFGASTQASVVDLKFLRFSWHSRLGTSNPKTTLDSINYKCGFESEIRPEYCSGYCEFRIRHTGTIGNGLYHRRMMDETPLNAPVDAPPATGNLREFTV